MEADHGPLAKAAEEKAVVEQPVEKAVVEQPVEKAVVEQPVEESVEKQPAVNKATRKDDSELGTPEEEMEKARVAFTTYVDAAVEMKQALEQAQMAFNAAGRAYTAAYRAEDKAEKAWVAAGGRSFEGSGPERRLVDRAPKEMGEAYKEAGRMRIRAERERSAAFEVLFYETSKNTGLEILYNILKNPDYGSYTVKQFLPGIAGNKAPSGFSSFEEKLYHGIEEEIEKIRKRLSKQGKTYNTDEKYWLQALVELFVYKNSPTSKRMKELRTEINKNNITLEDFKRDFLQFLHKLSPSESYDDKIKLRIQEYTNTQRDRMRALPSQYVLKQAFEQQFGSPSGGGIKSKGRRHTKRRHTKRRHTKRRHTKKRKSKNSKRKTKNKKNKKN